MEKIKNQDFTIGEDPLFQISYNLWGVSKEEADAVDDDVNNADNNDPNQNNGNANNDDSHEGYEWPELSE